MILYMTWFSEREESLRHESQNFHFLFRMDFGRDVTVVTLRFQRFR